MYCRSVTFVQLPPAAKPLMTRLHRLIVACIGLCLLAQLIPSGVSAQTEQIDQLRSDRDAVRADRARAAADLDPLLSANEQIEEALRVLTEDLASRQAELDATRFQLERARIEVIAAQDEVVLEQQRIADLRLQLATSGNHGLCTTSWHRRRRRVSSQRPKRRRTSSGFGICGANITGRHPRRPPSSRGKP